MLAACAGGPADPPAALELPADEWRPPGPPAALILAVHGFNDYHAGFGEVGAFFAANGILLRAYDQPGFGATPERGRWAGAPALRAALDRELMALKARYPGVPAYVMGESMGAAVTAQAAASPDFPGAAGIILVAPAVWGGLALSPLYRLVLNTVDAVAPGMHLTGSSLKILASDNIPMLIGLGRDPLFIKETRVDAIKGLVDLMGEARTTGPALHLPVLILSGYRDQVIPPSAQRSFAASVTSPSCTFAAYPNGWHYLLRDMQRVTVWTDVLAWIRHQPLPSRLSRLCAALEPAS